jgi:hypothetical protein
MTRGPDRHQSWSIAGAVAALVMAMVYGAGGSFLLALFLAITGGGLTGSFLTWRGSRQQEKDRDRARARGTNDDEW